MSGTSLTATKKSHTLLIPAAGNINVIDTRLYEVGATRIPLPKFANHDNHRNDINRNSVTYNIEWVYSGICQK